MHLWLCQCPFWPFHHWLEMSNKAQDFKWPWVWHMVRTDDRTYAVLSRQAVCSEEWRTAESKWWLRPLNPIWLQTRCISNHTASKGLIISLLINICIWILSIHINLLVYWDHFSYFFQCFFPIISLITSLNSHCTIWHIFRYYHLTGGD